MTSHDVLEIVLGLSAHGVRVWIDGGWCVDALLGRQTRAHSDLDVAVARRDVDTLRGQLDAMGFVAVEREGNSDWCFVLRDERHRQIDVHVFEYDAEGRNIYGIAYPFGSLTGQGVLDGQTVDCVNASSIFVFKTAYPPTEKDLRDVHALAARFGFPIPASHRPSGQ
ncbi:hypothetical protein POL68_31015 [Stigmatella sp. ncwal1]|uniref:Lincosamide nucleotidyltransferase A/C/D/E n=1 Tax=Stigmatella ashevillensis TaxID=2995309 RepID=A0ABT5DGY8_9BACT|nr:hypothetical protein [Stigmatella ashevillena]MDC0712934.1 hypothetical protein [Stigmatella ashevillena]